MWHEEFQEHDGHMATTSLTPEVIAFLSEGTRTGKLGYLAADGRPLVAPIWFVVDDEGQLLSFVQVQGTVSISDDDPNLVPIATRNAARYVGPDRAEEFGRRNGVPGELVVRVTPLKVIAAFDVAD
jgi:hypothetical protein